MALTHSNPTNADIVKGSALQVWIGDSYNGAQGTGAQGVMKCIGFCTSHSLNVQTNTNEVSTKDHGDFPAVLPTTTTWEVNCEALYSVGDAKILLDFVVNHKPVYLKFAQATNFGDNPAGAQGAQGYSYYNAEPGIIGTTDAWQAPSSNIIAQGSAFANNYTVTAQDSDNATMTVTFQGTSKLTISTPDPIAI